MQCGHCLSAERLRVPQGRGDDPIEPADRDGRLVCATCGGPLAPPGALHERLVAKLAQLARFGLSSDARPLFGATRSGG